jgi:hypothetical protein
MKRSCRVAVASVLLLAPVGWLALRARVGRWGATDDEVARPLPGDDLVREAFYVTTRAITIDAPAEAVFPWLVQLGQNRGGFYTYDALENLFGLDIHSADRVHPEWQALIPGADYVALDPEHDLKLTIVVLDRPHAFVIRTGAPEGRPQAPGSFFRGEIAATWAFVVEPLGPCRSRLLIRWRAAWRRSAAARVAALLLLEPVHFIMERGMLRGIRARAERASAAR